jgi:hypothetical protein
MAQGCRVRSWSVEISVQHYSSSWTFLLSTYSCLIMRACVILHNMIVDDERDADLDETYEIVDSTVGQWIYYNATSSLATSIQTDN